ncbi:neuronal tyrosine-phosphorylated phosphoinositide-3-kinase adapter 2, partial [Tachysurus ichikawai]
EGKTRSHSIDSKDRALRSSSPKVQDWDTPSGQSATPTRLGRSSISPTTMLGGGASEPKAACKLGRSASTSGVPSPAGTPQRHAPESSANQSGSPCQVLHSHSSS